jgi:Predicted integral membrane protein
MIKKNAFSILVALIIMYLSLASSHTFDSVTIFNSIPNFDKFVHVGMYFCLMSVIILEHRNSIHNARQLLIVGLIPAFYGILMEILQATLTQTRTGSVFDALADCIGILISIFIWLWFNPLKKIKSDNY